MGALSQRAVRELSDRAGIGEHAADDIIASVVNQLTNLDERAPWFTGDARLRERTIDETLRHAVLDEPVPSRPAQQAWTRYPLRPPLKDQSERGSRHVCHAFIMPGQQSG